MSTHYHALKVAHDAPAAVIRAAYRVLAGRHHPDRGRGDATAVGRMQAINRARDVLTCDAMRDAYDASLAARRMRRAGDPAPRTDRPAPQRAPDVAMTGASPHPGAVRDGERPHGADARGDVATATPPEAALRRRVAQYYAMHAALA